MTTTFIRGIEKYTAEGDDTTIIATIGTFDGIHLGHQEILKRVQQQSEKTKTKTVLVTFHPHPRVVVTPNEAPLLLTTIEEKEKFIPDFFKGQVLILDFDKKLMNMSAEQFVKDILVDKVRVKKLIVGYNHALGKDRGGNIVTLKEMAAEFNFEVEIVEPVMFGGQPISSSRIRKAIMADRFPEAVKMLGHDYAIYGTVERGIGLGQRLGYPTANVRYHQRKLLPPAGVYACWSRLDGETYRGMMFIGRNHFNPENRISVEANLFEFDRQIYDQEITVYPTCFIRGNRQYQSTEKLAAQINIDKQKVLSIFRKEQKDGFEQRTKSPNCH